MKKLICVFLFTLAAISHAQTNRFPPINLYNGDPTGTSCTIPNGLVQSTTNGAIYACVSGTYAPLPPDNTKLPLSGGTITGNLNVTGIFAAATAFYGQAAATSVITPMLVVGQGSTPFYGNIISSRTVSGANLFFDDIQAESSFTCTGGSCGYAAHDGRSTINASGGGVMNHALSFQASLTINAPAAAIYGMDSENVINAAVTELDDVHIYDWTGSGSVANHHGIQIDSWTNPGFSIYDAGNTGNFLGSPTQFGSTATFSGTAFNGVVFPGGGFLTLDSAGHLTPNPNLQITNGVIYMESSIAAEILATSTATLTLQSTNTNIAINPVGTNIATFGSSGLTMAANASITLSGTGTLLAPSAQIQAKALIATGTASTYVIGLNLWGAATNTYGAVQALSSTGGAGAGLAINPLGGFVTFGTANTTLANQILRCTTAGTTLPVGALTTVAGTCGASTASNIYIQ